MRLKEDDESKRMSMDDNKDDNDGTKILGHECIDDDEEDENQLEDCGPGYTGMVNEGIGWDKNDDEATNVGYIGGLGGGNDSDEDKSDDLTSIILKLGSMDLLR